MGYSIEYKNKGEKDFWTFSLETNDKEKAIEEAKQFMKEHPDVERCKVTKLVYTRRTIYDSREEEKMEKIKDLKLFTFDKKTQDSLMKAMSLDNDIINSFIESRNEKKEI